MLAVAIGMLAATGAAAARDKPVGVLLSELQAVDPATRQWAALGLGHAAPGVDIGAVVQALLGALGDPQPAVRSAARYALEQLGPVARAALREAERHRRRRLEAALAAPGFEDRQTLLVTLSRSGCDAGSDRFGATAPCPDYEVRLHGDGALLYRGGAGATPEGLRMGVMADSELEALLREFLKAGFLTMKDDYEQCPADDCRPVGDVLVRRKPTVTITLRIAGEEKTVSHYLGDQDAPASLADLEVAIGRLLAVRHWME